MLIIWARALSPPKFTAEVAEQTDVQQLLPSKATWVIQRERSVGGTAPAQAKLWGNTSKQHYLKHNRREAMG